MGRSLLALAVLSVGDVARCAQTAPAVSLRDKSVLILHSHERTLPAYEKADPALLAALRSGGLRESNLYFEYLDLRRNPSPSFRDSIAEHLRIKYGNRKIDVIIAIHLPSMAALFEPRYALFEGIPVIAALGMAPKISNPENHPLISLNETYDLRGTVKLALDLLPRTEQVLVVVGVHSSDQYFEQTARRQLQDLSGRVRISYLSGLSAEQMLRRTSARLPRTIILYLSVFEDVTGKSFVPKELLTEICKSATAPVFSIHDAVLDTGIVGGSMVSYADNADWAGRTALAVLRGSPAPTQVPGPPPNRPMFNWRALRRWGLSEARLPKDSVVVDRPPTIWNQYRGYVIGAVCLSLLQALLIAALSWQRHRRGLAEKSLRESEERFRGVLESSRDAAYRYNLQTGVFDYLSPVAGLILGYDLHEAPVLARTGDADRIHPEDRERVSAVATSTLRDGSAVYQVEYRFRCKNGEYRWIDDYGSVMRDAQGEPRLLTGALREITERKRSEEERVHLEAQLRQSQKMESIGRLAGGVAHDFNNLLTVINGYGELVASRLREDDPTRAQVEMIRQAGEHASRLTQQLLAFSRKQIIRPEPVKLNAAIANSEGMLRRLMGEDIRLRTMLDPDLGLVLVDGGQLDQVLMNLAANARDAMPTGGELVIQTANVELDESFAATHPEMVAGPAVLLAVTDTGTGMSEEVQRHVFEPFYTTKEKCRGTGLGLATVYGIVQQSRGWISVYSEPDKGSTFKIYFPRLPAGETEKAPSLASPPDSHGTETILVVEDQDSVRTLAVLALKSNGYVVLEAANGQQALRLAESCAGPIHAMVTDVVMPGMSGPELASRMKDVRPETRVIFTSGYTDDAVVTRGVLTRGVEYLSKPYSLGVLLATVRRVLGPGS